MNIFRRLRWKLTLSYTIVTVCALLVVTLVVGTILLTRIFLPNNFLSPETVVEILMKNEVPIWSPILSQSPVDTKLIKGLMSSSNAQITNFDFIRVGNIQFSVRTLATMRALIIGADKTLLGKFDEFFYRESLVGQPFDVSKVQGFEAPFAAALTGVTDPKYLYTELEKDKRLIIAIPINSNKIGEEARIVGVVAIFIDSFPTQKDIPRNILLIAGRFLIIFLFGAAVMGAIFGALTASGLAKRFKRMSTNTDRWSEGDFTNFIEDTTGDEIAHFANRLDNMAKQLQSLLRRRQEMAVSEERNRLARDLHDSAKQQALAASFELGTSLTLFNGDPLGAKKHLAAADNLVDLVRKELTDLVHELRPQSMDGQEFSEILKDYVLDWSHRSNIELEMKINIDDEERLSLETREALFRITQEALSNVARHSSAKHVDLILETGPDNIALVIKDNGLGFNPGIQHGGVGLRSMHERAEGIGGSLAIESATGQGTQISVALPIANSTRRDNV